MTDQIRGKLTFAMTSEECDEIALRDGSMRVTGSRDIRNMIEHLGKGGSAVGRLKDLSIGFRLPPNVDIDFTDSCPEDGPYRIQAEGRARQINGLYPHQERAIKALEDMSEEDTKLMLSRFGFRASPGMDNAHQQSEGRFFRPGKTAAAILEINNDTVDEILKASLEVKTIRSPSIEKLLSQQKPIDGVFDPFVSTEVHHIKDPFRKTIPLPNVDTPSPE